MFVGMFGRKSFSKLGKRSAARLSAGLEGGLVLPERTEQVEVENVSRTGCCLRLPTPPRLGASVIVRIERVEAFGSIMWVRPGRCGVKFDQALDPRLLERIRWITEHATAHEQNSITTAIWR